MSASNRELAATIYYPETDGEPMGETGEFLFTPEEEAAARQQAEARAEILAARLRELGVDPDKR